MCVCVCVYIHTLDALLFIYLFFGFSVIMLKSDIYKCVYFLLKSNGIFEFIDWDKNYDK